MATVMAVEDTAQLEASPLEPQALASHDWLSEEQWRSFCARQQSLLLHSGLLAPELVEELNS